MKFLDIKTDYAFKKVFGSEDSKDRLISFLNAIIYSDIYKDSPDLLKIKDLTIVDPYNIPMLKGMKDSFVDVKAVLSDNSKVIIEMQVIHHDGFEKRVLYNAAKNYSSQLVIKEQYSLLNPIIALSIVDFNMFEDNTSVITKFKLLEKKQFIDYSDDLELVFIELPKFTKEYHQLEDIKDEWIWFLKNASSVEHAPDDISNALKSAFEVANEANLEPEELELQYKKKEFIAVHKSSLTKATREGIVQGHQEGMQKGKIEIAKNLLDVLDNETIALKTGLRIEEVEALRKI